MKIINFLRYRIRKFLMEEITLDNHIKRGMIVGKNCSIMDGSTFDYGCCNLITIGNNVTIDPQAYILEHDASTKRDLGYTKIGRINIKYDYSVASEKFTEEMKEKLKDTKGYMV